MTRPTALLRSPAFQGHLIEGHPEHPSRVVAIEAELEREGLTEGRTEVPFGRATREHLERVHAPALLDRLERIDANGGGWLDGDTIMVADSLHASLLAAGAAVAAVDAVLDRQVTRAFTFGRPPGHHATAGESMGFCLVNHVAIAAAHALARGLERVAIVDWDVHHGNGTQDIFYRNGHVLFCSIHQSPFYPGTGHASERGLDEGAGLTINAPLPAGQGDSVYASVLDALFLPALTAFSPELLLVSAGFDASVADPIGGMRVTEAGFAALAARLAGVAEASAEGRIVAVLEGGYHPPALARAVAAVVREFDGESGRVPAGED